MKRAREENENDIMIAKKIKSTHIDPLRAELNEHRHQIQKLIENNQHMLDKITHLECIFNQLTRNYMILLNNNRTENIIHKINEIC